ncbi:ketopantoate reductase family protein [Roseisalinus antarcticus]|uniref:2-dehydropantoate 2-reductase n=1 Tax=Roseisalinus antarcticus TaxID=254357 RepID=A0A1Y5SU29_9RHOB|nr:2-dehydropantoate 2-reductase N-terminal domain-containing protein [Roseisalinus antarcticus]SLN48404.1 2-dehydropantoate 2-reductase [Roseisalinus antarcticus]
MRIIVMGVGAVGGTIAACLALAGRDVVGVARGAQLATIRAKGLRLHSPEIDAVARFDCVSDPADIALRSDDSILLSVKTQHTPAALEQLRAAGVTDQPIFCAQNGVENERLAARIFPNVHGMAVMLPADFVSAGEVQAYGTPNCGFFDIGRFPSGSDTGDAALAEALNGTGLRAFVTDDVMARKYGKLLLNLGNGVEAAIGRGADPAPFTEVLKAEAVAVFKAAGIPWRDMGRSDPRRTDIMRIGEIAGVTRVGSSSTQSLERAAGSIETDYMNGEIALLGRLHGVPTPANAALARIAADLAQARRPPGSMSSQEFASALGL